MTRPVLEVLAGCGEGVSGEARPRLTTRFVGRPLLCFAELESTNSLATQRALAGADEGTTIVADSQSAGRGRLQRHWLSPPGMNLYFSIVLRPDVAPERVAQLPLVAAAALLRALDRYSPALGAMLKWPNDILAGERKLCGILCECEAETDRVHHAIVGIGINVNLREFPPHLADSATSLRRETGETASRPALLAEALNAFETAYRQWNAARDLSPFLPFLTRRCQIMDRDITVQNVSGQTRGRVVGLAANGGLLLDTKTGRHSLLSGDVTLTDWRKP